MLIKEHYEYLIFFIKDTLSGLIQFLAAENLLEMMKNVFYFTLKALFTFWSCRKMIRKIRLISNFTTSQPG